MEHLLKTARGTLKISEPELYVDNASRRRSGHMSHAMVEYAPGKILDFNSNCSPVRMRGHAAYGWIEYRYSEDNGASWGEIHELPYAKQAFLDGLFTVSVEKAVVCKDGTIVAFGLRNDPLGEICCEPWGIPVAFRSLDQGKTWEEAKECSPWRGRVYDAVVHNDSIYFLEFCNANFTGTLPEHVYRVYRSDDHGVTFYEVGPVDIDGIGRGYGSMLFRPDGSLIVYAYNINDECHMDAAVSSDLGKTWKRYPACYVDKGIRNPQTAILDGVYILHGRAKGGVGFVFYTSSDGLNWDEGLLLEAEKRMCYYSNNLVLNAGNGKSKLLVQYSDTYADCRVNVMHLWIEWQ